MEEKYEIEQYDNYGVKGYEINRKCGCFTVKELKEIFDELVKQGKGDYSVHHEAFCCGTGCIDVMTSANRISID